MRGCASQAKNVPPFLSNFVHFKSIGEKYAFSPLFSSPFNYFFPPDMLFYHIFAPQEKYTPLVEWENLRYPSKLISVNFWDTARIKELKVQLG